MNQWTASRSSLITDIAQIGGLDMHHFQQYRKLRIQGDHPKALAELITFIKTLEDEPESSLRVFADGLCQIAWLNPNYPAILPPLLLGRVIVPCLTRWAGQDPQAIAPRRWLGLHTYDETSLNQARHLDAEELISRQIIIDRLIEQIAFIPEHLTDIDEGTLNLARRWAAEATQVAQELIDPVLKMATERRIKQSLGWVEKWRDMLVQSQRFEPGMFSQERAYERD